MKNSIYSLLLFLLSCNQSPAARFEWLLGTWETQSSKGPLYETWIKADDGNLKAKSYFLNGSDTVLFETVDLVLRNDSAFYVVHAADNALPISFASVELKEGLMAFENPKHDFPQRISYQRRGADSLLAEVSGMYQGQEASQAFPMKKIR